MIVPTLLIGVCVVRLVRPVSAGCSLDFAKPRSTNFAPDGVIMMFDGFRS
jgi:hypothetical protein